MKLHQDGSSTKPSLSRRQFLRILAISGTAGFVLKFGVSPVAVDAEAVSETRLLMGTVVNLTVIGADRSTGRIAVQACLDQMTRLEAVLSRFESQSQLSKLNQTGRVSNPHPALIDLVDQAKRIGNLSNGAFDITVKPLVELYQDYAAKSSSLPPEALIQQKLALIDYRQIVANSDAISFGRPDMQITLDGIAKGYIVDAGAEVLKQYGLNNILVEAGGDLMAAGQRAANEPWKIGVEPPRRDRSRFMAIFGLTDRAVATSGDYVQPFTADFSEYHILDPKRGHSSRELSSATVVAPTAALADALATGVMVLGSSAGLKLIDRLANVECLLVTKSQQIIQSVGFPIGSFSGAGLRPTTLPSPSCQRFVG